MTVAWSSTDTSTLKAAYATAIAEVAHISSAVRTLLSNR
jgi:hypothetical protein